MVFIAPFLAVALFSGFASALPRPGDSSINEPAVSAPNGIPMTASVDHHIPTSTAAKVYESAAPYGSSYGSSGSYGAPPSYGSSGSSASAAPVHSAPPSYGNHQSAPVVWTSTSSAHPSYSTPAYGSGSSNWNNQGYSDCVQQCVASYGGLSTATYNKPTATPVIDTPTGTGATHTVIVAPTQGVLRYIPFAVNASVGDTIKFMWGANNHTVTKGSALLPCNKSADALFASGTQNKDFVFTQVVNDTNPTFYYCATPNHCQRGMFGIINPPNALAAPTSVGGMMQSLIANSSDLAAYASYTTSQTAGNDAAARWGSGIDLASLPDWAKPYAAENVMYTRTFLAANPELMKEDGSIDLATSGTTPLMIPQDFSAALAASSASTPAAGSPPVGATEPVEAADPAPSGSTPQSQSTGGAASITAPKVVVGVIAAVATLLMM